MRWPWQRRRDREESALDADSYLCGSCGKLHRGLAFAFAVEAPLAWDALSKAERGGPDTVLEDEVCVIAGQHFFIRGLLEIPFVGGMTSSPGTSGRR